MINHFVSPLERGMRTAQGKRANLLGLRNNSPRSLEIETLRAQICLFWTALSSTEKVDFVYYLLPSSDKESHH